MRKVKFISKSKIYVTKYNLVYNKVYEVIFYDKRYNSVEIMVNGASELWQMNFTEPLFEDATIEYRSKIIDDILN
mgnify:CR=1 FL=1